MAKFIVKDMHGAVRVVNAEGFVPENSVLAPVGEYDASDLDETAPGQFAVNEAKKSDRQIKEKADADLAKSKSKERAATLSDLSNIKDEPTRAVLSALLEEMGISHVVVGTLKELKS